MYQQLSIVPQVWTSYATQGHSTNHSCFTKEEEGKHVLLPTFKLRCSNYFGWGVNF
jgi:hypothetical protein